MRKIYILVLVYLAIPLVLCAQSSAKGAAGFKATDPDKVFSWLTTEGSQIYDKEAARLKVAKGNKNFIRDELLDLYIEAKSSLKMQRAFHLYCSQEMSTEEFNFHSKSQKVEIRENEEKALRLLEILSRIPPETQEIKFSK